MTTFFLSAIERIPLGTGVAIEFRGPRTVTGLMSRQRRSLVWPVLAQSRSIMELFGIALVIVAGAAAQHCRARTTEVTADTDVPAATMKKTS